MSANKMFNILEDEQIMWFRFTSNRILLFFYGGEEAQAFIHSRYLADKYY